MKKFLAGLVVGLMLTTTTFAVAQSNLKLIVNGVDITNEAQPIIIEGRTLVPARALAERLGAIVEWDGVNNVVVVESEGQIHTNNINQTSQLNIDEPFVNNDLILKIEKLEYYSKAPMWTILKIDELPETHKVKDFKLIISKEIKNKNIKFDNYKLKIYGEVGLSSSSRKSITTETFCASIYFDSTYFEFGKEYTGMFNGANNNHLIIQKVELYNDKNNLIAIWNTN